MVEEVDPGVSFRVQYLIVIEGVVIDSVLLQIEILYRRQAQNFSCLLELGWVDPDALRDSLFFVFLVFSLLLCLMFEALCENCHGSALCLVK